jgi:hypothetical protein
LTSICNATVCTFLVSCISFVSANVIVLMKMCIYVDYDFFHYIIQKRVQICKKYKYPIAECTVSKQDPSLKGTSVLTSH